MNLLLDARRVLFEGLLSPSRSAPAAALDYGRAGAAAWLIRDVSIPTSQLERLAATLTAEMRPGDTPQRINALIDEPLGTAVLHASTFEQYMSPAARVVGLETQSHIDSAALAAAAAGISGAALPWSSLPDSGPAARQAIEALTRTDHGKPIGAVLRLGSSPPPETVAELLMAGVTGGIPLKVAGNSPDPIWSEETSSHARRCGLVNLLAATALAGAAASRNTVASALSDPDSANFRFSPAGLQWRDEFAGVPTLRRTRRALIAYGTTRPDSLISRLEEAQLLPLDSR